MKVVCISGKAQHGKDTVAKLMDADLRISGKKVLVAHYADLVKYVCKTFFNWDGNKDEYGRTLLQRVGTDVVRAKDPNYWVRFIGDMLFYFDGEWDYVLIPDTRFPNEIGYLKEMGHDVTHIRVFRPSFESSLTEEQKNHSSETALDKEPADMLIVNYGTFQDIDDQINKWIKENTNG